MESLNQGIVGEILDYLKKTDFGASASEISKVIKRNRITVSKYLEVMGAKGIISSKVLAQAKFWQISGENYNNESRPVVLIVDDEKNILDLIKLSLVNKKYQILEAVNGVEALELVREYNPDLILLDLMMPKMSGEEVCKILKQNPQTENIPIIILTAKSETSDKVDGLKSGADDYVTKPFNPLELEARADALLRRNMKMQGTNSVTGLPGYEELAGRLQETKAKILLLDIKNFRKFNEKFGYRLGNELLQMVARVIKSAIHERGTSQDFVAHVKSDDFVILTYANTLELSAYIIKLARSFLPILSDGDINLSINEVDSLDIKKEIKSDDIQKVLDKARVLV